MHVWERKRTCTYSILTDEWECDRRRKIMSKNKNQRRPESVSLSLGRSPGSSHSGLLFFLLFPAILPIPIQPSLLPKSVPYWSPFSSLPPPVFLASAGTLSPSSLSPSLSLSLSFSLSTADHALHFPLILCLCLLQVSIHRTLFSFFFKPKLPLQNTDNSCFVFLKKG